MTPAKVLDGIPVAAKPDEAVGVAIRVSLAAGLRGLLLHALAAKRDDVEGVHEMRKAARRLRAMLQSFRPFTDRNWTEGMIERLRWIGRVLGAVRDLDVLRERLIIAAREIALDPADFLSALDERRIEPCRALAAELEGETFWDLIRALSSAVPHPPVTRDADQACEDALPAVAHKAWKRLAKRARELDPSDEDTDFHEVRIRTKRLRYVAEAAAATLERDHAKAAAQLARSANKLLDLLGGHQDAVVARAWIRDVAASRPEDAPLQFGAGRLVQHLQQDIGAARAQYNKLWDKLDSSELRDWMKR
jgi:CHAD domain-containing protein